MELAFSDKQLRDLCLNESLARQAFGVAVAEKLKTRLADLAAVSVASELSMLPGRFRELSSDRRDYLVLDLIDGWQLIFQSGHVKERLLDTGEVDWSRIRRVKILKVEHDHE